MQEATLRLHIPGCWTSRLAGDGRLVRIVDQKTPRKRTTQSLVEIHRNGDRAPWEEILADVTAASPVHSLRIVERDEKRLLGIVQCRKCQSCQVLMESNCYRTSAVSREGRFEWTVRFDDRGELAKLVAALRRADATVEIRRITPGRGTSLTSRQAEVLAVALRMGYFEFPKRSGMEEIAARLGVSKSTIAETLHRAERKAVQAFLQGDASESRAPYDH